MEICCASNMSVSEDISSFCEVNSGSLECVNSDYGDDYINDLGNHFNEFLNIQAEKQKSITMPSLDDDRNCSASHEDACKNSCESELARMTSKTCLAKCATFPFGKSDYGDSGEIFEGEPGSMNDITSKNSMLSGDGQSSVSYSRSKSLPVSSLVTRIDY